MEKEQQESIAYEIAMLVKKNRELNEQLRQKDDDIKRLNSHIDDLRYELEKLCEKKTEASKAAMSENCDLDVKEGDRIVITWSKNESHCEGEVYEVAKCGVSVPIRRSNGEVYYNIGLKKFNEDGTEKTGAGSILSLKSDSVHWRKVDRCTLLSKRIKVVDKTTEGRWGRTSEQFHYEFENLMQL